MFRGDPRATAFSRDPASMRGDVPPMRGGGMAGSEIRRDAAGVALAACGGRHEQRDGKERRYQRPEPDMPQRGSEFGIGHDRLPARYVSIPAESDPKKQPIPRYLWYFRPDIGRMGTRRHGRRRT